MKFPCVGISSDHVTVDDVMLQLMYTQISAEFGLHTKNKTPSTAALLVVALLRRFVDFAFIAQREERSYCERYALS